MDFSQRLRYLRDLNKVTQEQLAKYLGVGRPTIAGYETKGKQPSFEILDKIAGFFNVSLDYLLGRTDIKNFAMLSVQDTEKTYYASNEVAKEINNLSPESQEDLEAYIKLLKIRDMQKRNTEFSDELTTLD